MPGTSKRGFAAMPKSKRTEIARKGGKASHGGTGRSGSSSSSSSTKSSSTKSRSTSTRGGTSEQHAKAGRQSHKNR